MTTLELWNEWVQKLRPFNVAVLVRYRHFLPRFWSIEEVADQDVILCNLSKGLPPTLEAKMRAALIAQRVLKSERHIYALKLHHFEPWTWKDGTPHTDYPQPWPSGRIYATHQSITFPAPTANWGKVVVVSGGGYARTSIKKNSQAGG